MHVSPLERFEKLLDECSKLRVAEKSALGVSAQVDTKD